MTRSIQLSIALILSLAAIPSDVLARGFGGFHGGGFGGFHGGGFGGGGFGGDHFGGGGSFGGDRFGGSGSFGGAHPGGGGSFGGDRSGGSVGGDHFGGAEGFGGDRAGGGGGFGGSLNRGQLNSFLGCPPTPACTPPAAPRQDTGVPQGMLTRGPWALTAAHGTAIRGPEGNVYAHTTVAGRGVAAGHGYDGANGTHFCSPTTCAARGMTAQRWCDGCGCFTPAWCAGHPWAWCPAGYGSAAWATAAWAVPAATAVGALAGAAAAPDYQYDYGDNITYQDGEVYYGSQPMGTQQQYYQGAANLAGPSPGANSGQQPQWLPLGVFGLIGQGQQTPEMVFQLALDKAGAIRGNYYDQVADTTARRSPGRLTKKTKGSPGTWGPIRAW